MARHYPDLGRTSDWLKQISHAARPIRSTTQIWIVTRHQYGISALVSQTSFGGETSDGVVKCGLLFFHTRPIKDNLGLRTRGSGFWIPGLNSRFLDSGKGIPDFIHYRNSRFLELYSGIQSQNQQAKICPIPQSGLPYLGDQV